MPASPVKDLGPCSVLWDPTPGANVELNPTFGGVIFRSEDAVVDILEDGRGTTPIDAVFTGRVASLEVPMTRTTLAKLNKILPGSVAGASNLKVSTHVGAAMFASSKPIIVKPIIFHLLPQPNGYISIMPIQFPDLKLPMTMQVKEYSGSPSRFSHPRQAE